MPSLGLIGYLPDAFSYGDGFWHSLLTILSTVVVDFLLIGCIIATACW